MIQQNNQIKEIRLKVYGKSEFRDSSNKKQRIQNKTQFQQINQDQFKNTGFGQNEQEYDEFSNWDKQDQDQRQRQIGSPWKQMENQNIFLGQQSQDVQQIDLSDQSQCEKVIQENSQQDQIQEQNQQNFLQYLRSESHLKAQRLKKLESSYLKEQQKKRNSQQWLEYLEPGQLIPLSSNLRNHFEDMNEDSTKSRFQSVPFHIQFNHKFQDLKLVDEDFFLEEQNKMQNTRKEQKIEPMAQDNISEQKQIKQIFDQMENQNSLNLNNNYFNGVKRKKNKFQLNSIKKKVINNNKSMIENQNELNFNQNKKISLQNNNNQSFYCFDQNRDIKFYNEQHQNVGILPQVQKLLYESKQKSYKQREKSILQQQNQRLHDLGIQSKEIQNCKVSEKPEISTRIHSKNNSISPKGKTPQNQNNNNFQNNKSSILNKQHVNEIFKNLRVEMNNTQNNKNINLFYSHNNSPLLKSIKKKFSKIKPLQENFKQASFFENLPDQHHSLDFREKYEFSNLLEANQMESQSRASIYQQKLTQIKKKRNYSISNPQNSQFQLKFRETIITQDDKHQQYINRTIISSLIKKQVLKNSVKINQDQNLIEV